MTLHGQQVQFKTSKTSINNSRKNIVKNKRLIKFDNARVPNNQFLIYDIS